MIKKCGLSPDDRNYATQLQPQETPQATCCLGPNENLFGNTCAMIRTGGRFPCEEPAVRFLFP